MGCIGYRLNIVGLRVFETYCTLVGRQGDEWVTIGQPRTLPLEIPQDPKALVEDPLLLTAYQFEATYPGTDLRDVLAMRKTVAEALLR